MPSATIVFFDYVCPTLGGIIATSMFAAPIKALQNAMERGSLGELNPTPWIFMTGNCVGWVGYAFLTHDYFILFANAPGILISMWLNFGAAKLIYSENFRKQKQMQTQFQRQQMKDNDDNEVVVIDADDEPTFPIDDEGNNDIETPIILEELGKKNGYMDVSNTLVPANASFYSHEIKVILILALWISTFSFLKFANTSHDRQVEIVGIFVNINLVVFFGAPLSTISKVLRTRSSASIHLGTMLLNILNTTFWTIYGLGLMSPYVIIPNGLGLLLGIIQGLLCLLFPRKVENENHVEFTLSRNDGEELI